MLVLFRFEIKDEFMALFLINLFPLFNSMLVFHAFLCIFAIPLLDLLDEALPNSHFLLLQG